MVRIQCLADGKLITYRVALASLSVLEFISKHCKFEQLDLYLLRSILLLPGS